LIEPELATHQHDMLADTYRRLGVEVHYMQPGDAATPNLYFARDHFFMTPQGAIMSRMGSAARAGEERFSAAVAPSKVPISSISITGWYSSRMACARTARGAARLPGCCVISVLNR
ncbi:MAG TPA: arginine deiminase-related protein, partial [Roseiflexaceae bacterium]|nr:arginine deiminase-related protein [Roseiflexaceae bacterium]